MPASCRPRAGVDVSLEVTVRDIMVPAGDKRALESM